ncbi:mastermind-like domain-containing protein 1 isoform X2 [Rhinatrema bivittatum]|uniref:mastermind-like domain-containing protein 1 isoform X2 n=1 Tax=Rhinatrema bivittatum TaxID=194408 RepID=UPI001125D1D7|nr:mastermind-like domain-containing protein 1 isoform X2 [Rhinatrema bivittatum]
MLLVSQRVEAPRMEPHIPLQGSIKRKLEDDSSPASSGIPDVIFPNENKRLCLDDVTLSIGHSQGANPNVSCSEMQNSPFTNHSASSMGVPVHPVLLDSSHRNGSSIGSPFSVPPTSEIGHKGSASGPSNIVPYDEKGNNMQSVDQELQDLLEELTKMPDPSPNELDLEKILGGKAEETLGMSHSQPSLSTTPKSSPQPPSHLENHISNKEFSPGCNPTSSGSPQMRPSSAGASYSVATSKPPPSTSQNKSQQSSLHQVALPNMPGANWHAQQLKQLAASKQVSSTKQQQVQAPSWPAMSPPGLSPPYRPASSPHHQPFSPQNVMVSGITSNSLQGNNIQSPQNALLSSMSSSTSNPSCGPSPPYGSEKLSSPALNQQPYSPQNPMLPSLSSTSIPAGNIKSPPSNLVSSMAATNTRPSPPYRPEKLSSPVLHQQPFSPQNTLLPNITPNSNPSSIQSTLFKSIASSQSKSMNLIIQPSSNGLQPSLVTESPATQDQFSFNNTKPLSHFAPEAATPKLSMSPNPGQPALIHYLQQQQQVQTTQQSQQVSNAQFLQQQLRQLMHPPPRMPRHLPSAGLPSQIRQRIQFETPSYSENIWDLEVQEKPSSFCGENEDQTAGLVPRLQEAGPIPSPGSGPAPPSANGYLRNSILKEQIMRRQLLQVKHRPNMMGVTPEQRSAFVAQQMNQFPTVPQPIPSDCAQPMPTHSPNHRLMASAQGLLQSNMGSGMTPSPVNQSSGTMVMIPHTPGKQQGIFPASSDFNIPLRTSQGSLGMSSGCQTAHGQAAVRPGMPLPGFTPGNLANHSAAQLHLRQAGMARIPHVYAGSPSQMWTPPGVPRMPSQSQMDASMQPFAGNPLFAKQSARPNMGSQPFPHQAVVPPNQVAPPSQIRQMQKLTLAQSGQGVNTLSSQNLRNSLTRGQLSAMNVMKPIIQGVPGFNPMAAAQLGPPSYAPSAGQSSGPFSRMSSAASSELPQYEFLPPPPGSVLAGSCSEADFIESIMKSGDGNTDEDWLNNLTMLDDILEQHTQNSGHV